MDGRNTGQVVVPSSVFAEVRPDDIAPRRVGRGTKYRPKVDTFGHLFGPSLSPLYSVTRRRVQGPSRQTDLPSVGPIGTSTTFSKDVKRRFYDDDNMMSVLHRPLQLNGSSTNEEQARCSAFGHSTEFPPLQRRFRASTDLAPMVIEIGEDLPRDIYWLGDPPPPGDLSNSTGIQPRLEGEVLSSVYEPTGQPLYDFPSAICWLGDPVLRPPQPKSDSCRSHLRPNPFKLPQTTSPPCKIRQQRNTGTFL